MKSPPQGETPDASPTRIRGISAVTLNVGDMPTSLRFYRSLGFQVLYGSEDSDFVTLEAGQNRLNLAVVKPGKTHAGWGRTILFVDDVDRMYRHTVQCGLSTDTIPRDAGWGERYFHVTDPDGHQLSFARPIPDGEV